MFQLSDLHIDFPPVNYANNEGLLAYGGDLSLQRLIHAYRLGIFPWYNQADEILWWSPDPRMVLFPEQVKISKSMRSLIRKNLYKITVNKAFDKVIEACAKVERKHQEGTWLHTDMQNAYKNLYKAGHAFSVEVWNNQDELVGGLYGVKSTAKVWTGESMFHFESNTSKLAFIYLANWAVRENIKLIDCQIYTDHLASLGAVEIPRKEFIKYLKL